MNDETANSLLKTLEEPPDFVVLLLLSDRPAQILPTIRSRCQVLRFDLLSADEIASRLVELGGIPSDQAQACARLSMGDGEAAKMLASLEGAQLRKLSEEFARSPLYGVAAKKRAWETILALGRDQSTAIKAEFEELLEQELEYLPKKEHRKCRTDYTERAQRAARRAETQLCARSLKLAGLWYRDLACLAAGSPELAYNSDRIDDLQKDLPRSRPAALQKAISLIDDTRAGLSLNLNFELACEALAYRLERLFAPD
jgi:DNA polymerase-3 subunit delta'